MGRPSIGSRTMSTPSDANKMSLDLQKTKPDAVMTLLTPPTSPRQIRSSKDLASRPSLDEGSVAQTTEDGLIVCPYDVEAIRDNLDHSQVFGTGAWSTVYKGTCRSIGAQTSGLATPPLSPVPRPPLIVAIKRPLRQDAKPILRNEAKILSRLMTIPDHESYVVSFYGVLQDESSLVLAAYPLSLEQHIKSCAKRARETLSTSNMFTPVVGSVQTWLNLSDQLVSALDWLHGEALTIHGDIKPGNILLESNETGEVNAFPYTPLFADFSSGQRLDTEDVTPNTLSAVTREYTAPELLNLAVLRDPKSTATAASDVFSLAVTLLVAATGDTLVYPGSVFQRQMLATQGWQVLDFARNGDQGSRVPRHGVVSRALERAVLKKDMGRISAERWRDLIEKMILETEEEPSKM